jgi:hypothetical protein
MKMCFTKIKDLDIKILLELDYEEVLIVGKVNKYFRKLCKDSNLWRNKLEKDFPKFLQIMILYDIYKNFYINDPRILYEIFTKKFREWKVNSVIIIK